MANPSQKFPNTRTSEPMKIHDSTKHLHLLYAVPKPGDLSSEQVTIGQMPAAMIISKLVEPYL
jgi:hypothetical protein